MDINTNNDNVTINNALTNVNLHRLLDTLIQKYEQNDYVYGRLTNYMEKLLPVALDNSALIYKQRDERKKQLTSDKDEFTNRFLQKNNYFYSTQSELFLHYDGLHFKIYSEDDIQQQILSTITSEQSLMEWKYKTNNNLLKRIREKTPLSAIPESATIQFVLNCLCPTYFSTRAQAKYFLTIVGDNIMAKLMPANNSSSANNSSPAPAPPLTNASTNANATNNPNLIYIASPLFKELLREISNQSYAFFGISTILHNIKFKYYDHNYKDCRLIPFNNKLKKLLLPTELAKNMIDLLCVASHYSQRYGSADAFLLRCLESKLVDHALFLNKNPTEQIVNKFLERTITVLPTAKISSKNMIFLWKNYLNEQNIPSIIFYSTLKNILKDKYKYEEESDSYLDITSAYLPLVAKFIKFWDQTMLTEGEGENELEVDEVVVLFKQFNTGKHLNMHLSESLLLDLIHHFYPDTTIMENKFIQQVKCTLWDKRTDVLNSLELFKLKCSEQEEVLPKSLKDAYEYYTASKNALIMSKRYFERVASELINQHMDADGLILASWWAWRELHIYAEIYVIVVCVGGA